MAKQQKVVIKIPKGLTYQEREDYGNTVIAYLTERTLNGLGKDREAFPGYSEEYLKKYPWKSDVNLDNTGDMLLSLQVLTHRTGSITIGYPAGDPINDKVEGNRLGTYGQPDPIPGKARDFLALSKDELQMLLADFVAELDYADLPEASSEDPLDQYSDDFWNSLDEIYGDD